MIEDREKSKTLVYCKAKKLSLYQPERKKILLSSKIENKFLQNENLRIIVLTGNLLSLLSKMISTNADTTLGPVPSCKDNRFHTRMKMLLVDIAVIMKQDSGDGCDDDDSGDDDDGCDDDHGDDNSSDDDDDDGKEDDNGDNGNDDDNCDDDNGDDNGNEL